MGRVEIDLVIHLHSLFVRCAGLAEVSKTVKGNEVAKKLRGARMRKRAKEGRCEGRKPYGYYDGEAAVLERIKTLRAERLGYDRIAARLNEEHVPTRTGRPWHGVVINRVLTGKR
jgi:hypothetical protein